MNMPFQSITYQVLIASPSDLTEERAAVKQVINEWNDLHSEAEQVHLRPMTWETHAVPETGVRPQDAINHQLVDKADLLIGMFWTKLGTTTGVAASGTVEEIDRVVAAGKTAMLYFSSRPIAPDKINPDQIAQLRQFKEDTYNKALCGTFDSVDGLKVKVSNDLTRRVRMMKKDTRAATSDVAIHVAHTPPTAEHDQFKLKIHSQTFMDFRSKLGIMAVSIIPVNLAKPPLRLGKPLESIIYEAFSPLGDESYTIRPKKKSVLLTTALDSSLPPPATAELTDDGRFFTVYDMTYGRDREFQPFKSNFIPPDQYLDKSKPWLLTMGNYQRHICTGVQKYLLGMKQIQVAGPWWVFISLLNMRNCVVVPTREFAYGRTQPLDQNDVDAEPVLIPADADLQSSDAVWNVMIQPLREIWRSCGYKGAPVFENGRFIAWDQ
jgi:hypothetical protein